MVAEEGESNAAGHRIWLVTIGEPLPLPGNAVRLLRTGWLAQELDRRGHRVVWWTSTFDHSMKRFHFPEATSLRISERTELRLLHGTGYNRNVGLSRVRNHWQLARQFAREAPRETRPGAILCSWPTVELSAQAVRYGKRHAVPVALDIRDLWPDVLRDAAPPSLRWAARALLAPSYRAAAAALAECDSIIGISPGYLNWALRLAGRQRRDLDIVLPLGYRKPEADAASTEPVQEALIRLGVAPNRFLCWFVGSFAQTIDLGTVIETASLLRNRPDIQFVLSGDGDKGPEWRAAAQGLPNVVFTGWIDLHGISALMAMASAGLAAYAKGAPQGMPNKLFEYLCGGLPVLSSLGDEACQLLAEHECGATYPAGDARSLAGLILDLADNPEKREAMARRAKALYENQFDADRIYERMADFAELLAAQGETRRRAEFAISEPARSA